MRGTGGEAEYGGPRGMRKENPYRALCTYVHFIRSTPSTRFMGHWCERAVISSLPGCAIKPIMMRFYIIAGEY